MSTLHERLADLATDAPAPHPDPLLWDRAARFHRRRRAATAGLVAVAVLAVFSLVGIDSWQRSPGVDPAAPGAEPALPARIWEPSEWLPGNGGKPTGPLALLQQTPRRGWTGAEDGVVGVSATTGEYLFLDLPDDAHQGHALSPDGSKVAYWLTGETTGSPQTSGGQELPVVGIGVWDAENGEVKRHEVETEHGLGISEDPVWADATALVMTWGEYRVGDDAPARRQGGYYTGDGLRVWDVAAEAAPRTLGLSVAVDAGNGSGKVLLTTDDRPVLDVRTGQRSGPSGRRTDYGWVSALSPEGDVIAFPRKNPGPLLVLRGDGRREVVVEEDVDEAVAWIDADTLVFATSDPGSVDPDGRLEAVSLATGERRKLIEAGSFQHQPGNVATDLLAVEPRDFPQPQQPWDPRVVAGLVLLVTLLAGLWLWGWRRRVEP